MQNEDCSPGDSSSDSSERLLQRGSQRRSIDATTAEKSGCGSTIALSALALVPMLGAAVVFGKKRED